MRIVIAVAALLIGAQPSWACHKFSKWYYPFPQRCYVSTKVNYEVFKDPPRIIPDVIPPIKPDDAIVVTMPEMKKEVTHDDIPIPELPSSWEEIEHDEAQIKLRLIQQGNWKDK